VETLDDRIARDGPVKELDAVGWAIRLAKRLEALHSLGVAHGSVSPACILTAGADRTSRAFLADVQVTTSSVAFQSPERLLGGDLSPADDTWAVACTLYAALTGTSPFAGGSDAETKQKILGGQPAPLAVYDVGDDDLQHIIDTALLREPGQRTATVSALRNALEEWHPDPGVGALSPLDDDDDDGAEGEDEDMRTVMRAAPAFLSASARKPAPAPAPSPPDDDDDDDDEDQATRMREFQIPAHLVNASPFGNGPPGPAPYAASNAAAARAPGPRPAAGRALDDPPPGFSAPAALGGPAAGPFGAPGLRPGAKATLLGPGGPGAFGPFGGAAPRNAVDDDDDDDNENARTMMRTSPIDETSHPSGLRVAHAPAPADDDDDEDGARTMMRDANDPVWGGAPADRGPPPPAPSAPRHFGGAPLGAAPRWPNDPAPARTMALDGFELPAELTPHPGSGAFPRVQDHGPPSGISFGAPPGQPAPPPTMAFPAIGTPLPGPMVAPFQAGPQPGPMGPLGGPMGPQGPTSTQLDAAAAAANSRRIIVLTAAIALLIIAATTFIVLLLRGIK
jgi:protein kinase-like protein